MKTRKFIDENNFRCGPCNQIKYRGTWITEKSRFGEGDGAVMVCKKCFDENPQFKRAKNLFKEIF